MSAGAQPKYVLEFKLEEVIDLFNELLESNVSKTVKNRVRAIWSLLKNENSVTRGIICQVLGHGKNYLYNLIKLICTEGLAALWQLGRSPKSNASRLKLGERAEGFLVALACTPPPFPYARWTVELLTEEFNKQMAELGLPDKFSKTTVWRVLNKQQLKPHLSEYWCIPEVTEQFILRMEIVLRLYSLPYDRSFPVVCMDEAGLQIIRDLKPRLEMIPGESEKQDYEYVREGTKNLYVCIEPKTGKYFVRLTDSHSAIDWAYAMRHMVDHLYANAKKVIIISDNLATHNIESFYKAFPPEEARRIVKRIEIVHTPLHASWLNKAEIAINVLRTQCIGSRFRTIDEINLLEQRLLEWTALKNEQAIPYKNNYTVELSRQKDPNLHTVAKVETNLAQYKKLNELSNPDQNLSVAQPIVCAIDEDDNDIIELYRCIDSDRHEYWSISIEENRILINEETGKKKVIAITGQSNRADGWPIPLPSNPRIPKDGKKSRPVRYDHEFIAHGEDIVELYTEPYDPNCPVICIQKRPLNIEDISQNTWVGNLHSEKSKTKKQNNDKGEVMLSDNTEQECVDTRLGISIAYEPLTGRKSFLLSDWTDDQSWAEIIRNNVTNLYKDAKRIRLVINKEDENMISTLQQLCTADDALDIYTKLDVHLVPEKGKWMNFAEVELITLCRKCVTEKVSSAEQVATILQDWQKEKTSIQTKLTIDKFRRIFSKVYMPAEYFINEHKTDSVVDST